LVSDGSLECRRQGFFEHEQMAADWQHMGTTGKKGLGDVGQIGAGEGNRTLV
jgi:hypothetical protein